MSKSIAAVLFSLALVAAACSGGEDDGDGGVASIDDVVTAPEESAPAAADDAADGGDEVAVLEFAACMRTAGVDFPDPEVDADGNVGFDLQAMSALSDVDETELESAFESCASLLEGVSFGFEQVFESEFQDAVLEFSACMRENGFDMPDPDFSRLTTDGQVFSEQIDIDDPDFEGAFEVCQDTLPGIPGLSTE